MLRLQRSLSGCKRLTKARSHCGALTEAPGFTSSTPRATYANTGAHFSLVGSGEVTDALVAPMAAVQPGGQSVDLGEIIDGAQLQL